MTMCEGGPSSLQLDTGDFVSAEKTLSQIINTEIKTIDDENGETNEFDTQKMFGQPEIVKPLFFEGQHLSKEAQGVINRGREIFAGRGKLKQAYKVIDFRDVEQKVQIGAMKSFSSQFSIKKKKDGGKKKTGKVIKLSDYYN